MTSWLTDLQAPLKFLSANGRSRMNHYMVGRVPEGRGNPVFFDYLYEDGSGGENKRELPAYVFNTSYEKEPVIFICKHRVINFDYYDLTAGEHFISDKFLSVVERTNPSNYKTISVSFLNRKRENIAEIKHFTIRLFDRLDAVDAKKTIREPHERYPSKMVTKHLSLDQDLVCGVDLFRIKDPTLSRFLLCSEKFKEKAESVGLEVEFVPVDRAAEVYHERNP